MDGLGRESQSWNLCWANPNLDFLQAYRCEEVNVSTLMWRVVQSLSCVWLFVTPWTAVFQASPSFTISQGLLKLMSIELMLSNHILCFPLFLLLSIFPSIKVFSMSWLIASGGQNIGASDSASVIPMNIQGWFPLGLTGLISLLSKRLSRVFSSTTVQKHQFFSESFQIHHLSRKMNHQ